MAICMREFFEKPLVFYVLLLMSLMVAYSSLLIPHENFDIDFQILVSPLKQVSGLQDYLHKFFEWKFADVQPIRDFSYFIDLKILSIFSEYTSIYYVINILIFSIALIYIRKILSFYVKSLLLKNTLVILYAVYPVFSFTISQISARKHLLAFMFIAMAIYEMLKIINKRSINENLSYIKLLFFYTLSVLSQPIGIFFPFFFILMSLLKENFKLHKKNYTWYLLILLLFSILLFINMYYYTKIYPQLFGVDKILSHSPIVKKFLAFSRSITQIIVPYQFSTNYTEASPLNLIGLPLFILISYFSIFTSRPKELAVWLIFIIISLAPVTFNETNIFVSDTYLLLPSISLLIYLGIILNNNRFKYVYSFIPVSTLFFILITKTFYEARLWSSQYHLSKKSYFREPSCKTGMSYALVTFKEKRKTEFLDITQKLITNQCLFKGMHSDSLSSKLFTYYIYFGQLPVSEKIEKMHQVGLKTIDYLFSLGSLYSQVQNINMQKLLLSDLKDYQKYPNIKPMTKAPANEWFNNIKKNHIKLDTTVLENFL